MRSLIFLLIIYISCEANAQTASQPLIATLDQNFETIGKKAQRGSVPSYYRAIWKNDVDNNWHAQILRMHNNTLYSDFGCADSTCTVRDGWYMQYYVTGSIEDSSQYVKGSRHGLSTGFHFNGELARYGWYYQDMPVDTCLWWDTLGNLTKVTVTDSTGNGKVQELHPDGSLKAIGRLMLGKRSGRWLYKRPNGSTSMDVVYLADTIFSAKCISETGEVFTENCVVSSLAEPPANWKIHFSRGDTKVLDPAMREGIDGIVTARFMVTSQGKINSVEILASPHFSLSEFVKEALRTSSPWKPGVALGLPVDSWKTMDFTFRFGQ